MIRFLLLVSWLFCLPVMAAEESAQLPIPRFASLRSKEVFVRVGPGKRYPISWVYRYKYAPVEIVQEYEHWRKIRDWEGQGGWVHKSMLVGKRAVYVKQAAPLKRGELPDSATIAKVQPGAFGMIEHCEAAAQCEVTFQQKRGWLPRAALWGVYDEEVIK